MIKSLQAISSMTLIFILLVGFEINKNESRMASALEESAMTDSFRLADDERPQEYIRHQRRNITHSEDEFILKTRDCMTVAYVGYDNQIHPEYCQEDTYPKGPCTQTLSQAQHAYSVRHPEMIVPVCNQ